MQGLRKELAGASVRGVADITIAVDCTSSMYDCIDGLKSRLEDFIDLLEKPLDATQAPVQWRMRIFGFRDLEVDSEAWINRDAPFVESIGEAKAQITLLNEKGGGDPPESALDALWYAVEKSPWGSNRHKVVLLFTDAPPLPNLHSSTIADGAIGGDANTVAQSTLNSNAYVLAWAPEDPAWETFKAVPKWQLTKIGEGNGLADVDFSKILAAIANTISKIAVSSLTVGSVLKA